MALTRDEIRDWALAYIEAQREPSIRSDSEHPLRWAIERFNKLADPAVDPQDAWEAILEILHQEPSSEVLGILAAGPLEDLVDHHGPAMIERIEVQARKSGEFRELLRSMWDSGNPEVWDRVLAARRKA